MPVQDRVLGATESDALSRVSTGRIFALPGTEQGKRSFENQRKQTMKRGDQSGIKPEMHSRIR